MPTTKAQTDEHPIIFSGWSIQRILAGDKAQTRRVVKPQPPESCYKAFWDTEGEIGLGLHKKDNMTLPCWDSECPYGKPGSRLWVREAFRLPEWADDIPPNEYVKDDRFVKGTPAVRFEADGRATPFYDRVAEEGWGRKRPSIHMPRALCRLVLRVEEVCVQRVQEISEADAVAEGVEPVTRRGTSVDTISAFKERWNVVHGSGAWKKNPWVWVVSFSKIDE